jgi:hypothetical protein
MDEPQSPPSLEEMVGKLWHEYANREAQRRAREYLGKPPLPPDDDPSVPPKEMNGHGFGLVLFAAALVLLGVVVVRGFERLETMAAEQRTGRESAVAGIARDHRELLCILAMDQSERKAAVRTGDVCGVLLGNHMNGGPK